MNSSLRKRDVLLDVLRGGAALCIVLYHYTTRYEEVIGHKEAYVFNVPYGYMAWAVFFILTGYFVYPKPQPLKRYIFGKIIRLYPVYWAAMVISQLSTFLLPSTFKITFKDFILDLTMFGSYLGAESAVGVDWSLLVTLTYYIFIGLIIFTEKKLKKSIGSFLIFVWGVISTVILFFQNNGVDNRFLKIFGILVISKYAHFFVAGYFLRRIKTESDKKVVSTCTVVVTILQHWIAFKSVKYEIFYSIIVAVFLLYLYLDYSKFDIVCEKMNWLWKPFVWVAGISYPLYLVHEYMGFAVLSFFDSIGLTSEIFMIVPIILSFILAYIIHRYIEIPCNNCRIKINKW